MARQSNRIHPLRALRVTGALLLAVSAATAGAAAVRQTPITSALTPSTRYLGDVSPSSTGEVLVAWTEGAAGRRTSTSGQGAESIFGSSLAGPVGRIAAVPSTGWVHDIDITDNQGTPVVAWSADEGLYVSEWTDSGWGPAQRLLTGRSRAVAAVQPSTGTPTFIAESDGARTGSLWSLTRGTTGEWMQIPLGRTSQTISARTLDAARLDTTINDSPTWWRAGTTAVLAPSRTGVLRIGAANSSPAITWHEVASLGVRSGQGGIAAAGADALVTYGGRRKRQKIQDSRGVFRVSRSSVVATTAHPSPVECDVSAFGAGVVEGEYVELYSGGCGMGIGATWASSQRGIDLMGSQPYGLIIGSGFGGSQTVVLATDYSTNGLAVIGIGA